VGTHSEYVQWHSAVYDSGQIFLGYHGAGEPLDIGLILTCILPHCTPAVVHLRVAKGVKHSKQQGFGLIVRYGANCEILKSKPKNCQKQHVSCAWMI
jgi:hypothetical protein